MSNIRNLPKKLARLAAVQTVFQSDLRGERIAHVAQEFVKTKFAMVLDIAQIKELSTKLFVALTEGYEDKQEEIDHIISSNLSEGWSLERIDSVSRAILRVGLYELLFMPDTPAVVVVSEYSDLAHAFFDDKDAGFVNGVLNNIARVARHSEFMLT
ncbi:MAG: transcription antitermination factor NusB [Alphaproteobacteria bacterium]|nr:transcription antitermination factor NusB [Alphaproteobacteria bacterium]OJV47040.1 MAG: transcription antitermination factor NusB [Alphaproteobacteria bacterium 43-37]